jgi:hypothetical protein
VTVLVARHVFELTSFGVNVEESIHLPSEWRSAQVVGRGLAEEGRIRKKMIAHALSV